jgi:hypothetical protein
MSGRGRDGGGEAPEPMAGEDLVSLLYGELPAEEAERTGARVAADPTLSARLGEMRRVRDLFGSLEDEEPPGRLSAQLMAEAARAAPQQRRAAAAPEAGLWSRLVSWLQPVVQRPALAAAASLVLVAGVAGVLYMKKGEELTSTAPPPAETASELEGTASSADPTAASPVGTANEAPADSTGTADGADDEAAPAAAEPAREESNRADQPVAKRRKSAVSEKSADTGKNAYDKAPAKPAVKSGTVYGLSEQEMVPREQAKGESGEGGGAVLGGADSNGSSKSDAPKLPPPPASAPAPTDEQKPAPRANVRDLHKRAIDAALDNRCTEVRSLAGQVKTSDSSYYTKSFANDGRLRSCLSPPQKTAPAKKK